MMAKTFKILAALLSYPTQDIADAAGEFAGVLEAEALLPRRDQTAVNRLAAQLASRDLYDLQDLRSSILIELYCFHLCLLAVLLSACVGRSAL